MKNPDSLNSVVLEIRDEGTHIAALAIEMVALNHLQAYGIYDRSGYCKQDPSILLIRLEDGVGCNDPYGWKNVARTMPVAHQYIEQHFDELIDGEVIDVQFILGETAIKKVSERYLHHPL